MQIIKENLRCLKQIKRTEKIKSILNVEFLAYFTFFLPFSSSFLFLSFLTFSLNLLTGQSFNQINDWMVVNRKEKEEKEAKNQSYSKLFPLRSFMLFSFALLQLYYSISSCTIFCLYIYVRKSFFLLQSKRQFKALRI